MVKKGGVVNKGVGSDPDRPMTATGAEALGMVFPAIRAGNARRMFVVNDNSS